jgi:hypothetical protein
VPRKARRRARQRHSATINAVNLVREISDSTAGLLHLHLRQNGWRFSLRVHRWLHQANANALIPTTNRPHPSSGRCKIDETRF